MKKKAQMKQQINQNLKSIKKQIDKVKAPNQKVKLVAVTKTRYPEEISAAISGGVISIGENRVQEAEQKFTDIPKIKEIEKRLVGKLQSNKIKKAIQLFDTIDAVDSTKLAKKISKAATAIEKKQRVLVQVNTSNEKTKNGFDRGDIKGILGCFNFSGIKIEGLMTVGPTNTNKKEREAAFKLLAKTFITVNSKLLPKQKMTELSMGMSGDFLLGISCGSTMVRVGTAIFGKRETHA